MIKVSAIERVARGDTVELSASIDGLPGRPRSRRAWISAPLEAAGDDARHDGSVWLVAMLPSAVCLGRPLRIEGGVSSKLLGGCQEAMRLWSRWWRWIRPVAIDARAVKADPRRPERRGCFFSGGVDSSYAVAKELRQPPDPPLSDLILIDGFDLALEAGGLSRSVSERLARLASRLGLGLVKMATNLRSLTGRFADWGRFQHGPLLAALGLTVSARYRQLLIPATNTYDTVFPWASHPELDPLWSTEATTFLHEGLEADRVEKVRLVARSPELLSSLRVCYRVADGAYNCGRCEKCQRTMVNLIAAGAPARPPGLEGRPDPRLVAHLPPDRIHARHNLEALERQGIEPELQSALRSVLRRRTWRLHYRWAVYRARVMRYRLGLPR